MAPGPGPLGDVADQLRDLEVRFRNIADAVKGVWLIGAYFYLPFSWISNTFGWARYYMRKADERIEALDWDRFIDSFERWVMKFLGARPLDFILFQDDLFAFALHRMGLSTPQAKMASYDLGSYLRWRMIVWWGFLDDILDDASTWVRKRIIARWPILRKLFTDPVAWVMHRFGADMWQVAAFRDDIPAWIFYRLTGSYTDALFYKWNLIEYVKWKLRQHWKFIDDLVTDPVEWVWRYLRRAIDRYIDTRINWVINTSERVINLIWQARV